MAGLGRKTFSVGEVLRAADVNQYLMDQAVMVFPGTAARGSAIGTAVSEGMVSYISDDNVTPLQVYGGAAWDPVVSGDTGWTTLTFTAGGWSVAETVQYRKIGQVVYFIGEIFGGTVGATVVANIPAGFRPAKRTSFPALDFGAGTSDGRFNIATNGDVTIYGANGGAGSPGITLGSISYVVA